jgi:hypothetical protein
MDEPSCYESILMWCGGGSYVPSTPMSCLDDDVATVLIWKDALIAALTAERDEALARLDAALEA